MEYESSCFGKIFEIYLEIKIVDAHLYGTPEKFDELKEICNKHNVIIIDDTAESLDATYKGIQIAGLKLLMRFPLMKIKLLKISLVVCF